MLMISTKIMDLLGGCLCYSTKCMGGDTVPLPSILLVFEYANSAKPDGTSALLDQKGQQLPALRSSSVNSFHIITLPLAVGNIYLSIHQHSRHNFSFLSSPNQGSSYDSYLDSQYLHPPSKHIFVLREAVNKTAAASCSSLFPFYVELEADDVSRVSHHLNQNGYI